jgi:hypothetical protein
MDAETMAAFGASESACYKWPDDTDMHRACRAAFCDGAGWAAAEIERLTRENERLRDMVDNRNEFIAERGLWRELGQYLSEPSATEQSMPATSIPSPSEG